MIRDILQNMFYGNRCYEVWLLCTCARNHPRKHIYSCVTEFQCSTLLKYKTPSRGLHCVKKAKIGVFSDLYFPLYWQNRIRIFPYLEYSPIPPKYRKIWIWFCSYIRKYGSQKVRISVHFKHLFPVQNFCNGLTWKYISFRDIDKFHQPSAITPLQLRTIKESKVLGYRATISKNNSGLRMIYNLKSSSRSDTEFTLR